MSRFLPFLAALLLLALAPLTAGCDDAEPFDPIEDVDDPDTDDPEGDDSDSEDPEGEESDDPDGDDPPTEVDAEALAELFGCEVAVVAFDTAAEGALDPEGDCVLDDGRMVDYYAFLLTEDTPLAVEALSDAFDTVLSLYDADGALLAENDDMSGDNTDSVIEVEVPAGVYVAALSAFEAGQSGAYLFLTK